MFKNILNWLNSPTDDRQLFGVNIRKAWTVMAGHSADDMVDQWMEAFPDKCMICSYHRFGRDHGLTKDEFPVEHTCIDKKE